MYNRNVNLNKTKTIQNGRKNERSLEWSVNAAAAVVVYKYQQREECQGAVLNEWRLRWRDDDREEQEEATV